MSGMNISLPEDLVGSLGIPEAEVEGEILKELAVALYARGALTAGKARKLGRLNHWQFIEALAQRRIEVSRSDEDVEEELAHARGEDELIHSLEADGLVSSRGKANRPELYDGLTPLLPKGAARDLLDVAGVIASQTKEKK
jgi:predicted HTH domain antitoxin